MVRDIEKQAAELAGGKNFDKEKILAFLNTPEGRQIASRLGGSSLISGFLKNMSNEDISNKLRQADLSKLKDVNLDDIMKKLR